MEYRPPQECERLVEHHADRADDARACGRIQEAERELLLAWAAYDDLQTMSRLDEDKPAIGQIRRFPDGEPQPGDG